MEQPMRCKTLTAIYKNEINTLKKLYEIDFLIHESVRIHIEQFTVRKIEIDFTSEQLVDDLIAVLTKVERLLNNFVGICSPFVFSLKNAKPRFKSNTCWKGAIRTPKRIRNRKPAMFIKRRCNE